jgi:PAS domain S-box-containing protein
MNFPDQKDGAGMDSEDIEKSLLNKKQLPIQNFSSFRLLYTVLITILSLISCSGDESINLNRAEREYLSHKSEIVFVGEENYPPFEFIQKNGSYGGMSIELLRWIATETGFNIDFIPVAHGEMQRYVFEGKADAVAGLFESPERKKNFIMTDPYFIIPGTIFVKTERPDIKNADDLQNKRIALMIDDYAEEWLLQHNIKGDTVFSADFSIASQTVINGNADALIGDEQAVLYFLYSGGKRNFLKKITPPLYYGRDCVAVSKNDPILASILNKGIKYADKTGIIKKISDKWLGVPVDTGESFFKKFGSIILAVVSSLLMIILMAFFWIFLLRREVARRTTDLKLEINKLTDTEKELTDAVIRYRGIYENTPDSIFWIREENGSFFIENVNPAHKKNTGIGNEEVQGKNVEEILPPELSAPVVKNYTRCIRDEKPVSYEEEVLLGGENKIFWTLLVPISDEHGRYSRIVGFSRDVTSSRHAEMSVRHTQKLESLGVLAGGIAHDFNNLLSAIMGNIDLTIHSLPTKGDPQKYLESALLASRRAADLCSQLLAYSGKGISEFKKVDLNSVISEMMSILEVSVSKKTIFKINIMQNIPMIYADPSQIRQIVMNLVINASEALGESGGNVNLSTGSGHFKKRELSAIWTGEYPDEGLYVWITVKDTGCGMNEETLSHLFDPFFTTKFTGRGLGLSAILGIVRGHKGTISVKSSPGAGSSFTVFFPAENTDEKPQVNGNDEGISTFTDGFAMVVDDEEGVRNVARSMLQLSGFTVITSYDGFDALEKLSVITKEASKNPDVILLDLTMPHMDGSETFRKIIELSPESRIILMSGYSEHDISKRFADAGIAGFLQKPFQLQDLRKKISEVLK